MAEEQVQVADSGQSKVKPEQESFPASGGLALRVLVLLALVVVGLCLLSYLIG